MRFIILIVKQTINIADTDARWQLSWRTHAVIYRQNGSCERYCKWNRRHDRTVRFVFLCPPTGRRRLSVERRWPGAECGATKTDWGVLRDPTARLSPCRSHSVSQAVTGPQTASGLGGILVPSARFGALSVGFEAGKSVRRRAIRV